MYHRTMIVSSCHLPQARFPRNRLWDKNHVQMGYWCCSWVIPLRRWGRRARQRSQLTCTAVAMKASADSLGSSGAGTDPQYCPRLRKYGWIFLSLHQSVSSQLLLGRACSPDWGSSLWLRAAPREAWSVIRSSYSYRLVAEGTQVYHLSKEMR